MIEKDEWHPDIEVDEKLVKHCIEQQFSELMPIKSIRCIGEGWDNKVFLINDKIVFRFPHRKIFIELIEQENLILNKLPVFQNIKIPALKYLGHPTIEYPYAFHGYELIVGTPAYQLEFTEEELVNSLVDLAKFLKKLHSIDERKAMALGAQPQIWDRTNIQKSTEAISERVKKNNERNRHKINTKLFEEETHEIKNISFSQKDRCLVHGDLDFRHILFYHQKLVGIIDWDDLGVNDRSV
ncbi:MAG: phosphotransferase [Gammaproteobacteria bacterium]